MINENTGNQEELNKNISQMFVANLFDSLMRLQEYERLSREGCRSILEYVQIPTLQIAQIQHENYHIFLTEFNILLINVKKLINEKEYNEMLKKYNALINWEKEHGSLLQIQRNEVKKSKKFYLADGFSVFLDKISELRALMTYALWDLIKPTGTEIGDLSR